MNRPVRHILALLFLLALQPTVHADDNFKFKDMNEQLGLAQTLQGWAFGHAGAWGDINGDGLPELYLGAFADRKIFHADDAPVPNPLFINSKDGFTLAKDSPVLQIDKHARSTSALFVDVDNDGDLELVVSNHTRKDSPPSLIFENRDGQFFDVTPTTEPWPIDMQTRNVAAADMDGDGTLELIFADGRYDRRGHRLVVLKHLGDWKFADITESLGLPVIDAKGLGLALGDLNNDGRMDLFIAGANSMWLSTADGKYERMDRRFPAAKTRNDGFACGAVMVDIDGDDLLDLIYTMHDQPGRIYAFLNVGRANQPHFRNVTTEAGLDAAFPKFGTTGLAMKNAHLALEDMDNDGRPDLVLPLIKDAGNGPEPVVLRNLSTKGKIRFTAPPVTQLVVYSAPAPVADYDRDGRMDIFFPRWFDDAPYGLFRNITPGGHHLTVSVTSAAPNANRMGVGATVRLYELGKVGDPDALLGRREIAIGTGYSSGEEALAHFGLGDHQKCDVKINWLGQERVLENVTADQLLEVRFD